MKILFNSLQNIKNSKIYVDFGNGYKSFNLSEVQETGIEVPDGVDTSKIKLKTSTNLIKSSNLYDNLFIANECLELQPDLSKSTVFPDCYFSGDYVIPDGVTSIGDDAFQDYTSLTSIEIPDGVTSIGRNAFNGCTSLTNIVIPDSVTSIGTWAFYKCSSLTTSIEIPDGITSIGEYTFSGCKSLTSIEIPEGVKTIGNGAFHNCTSLTNIEIPNSVTSMGFYVFEGCTSLESVILSEGVTSIIGNAFRGCTSLTSIEIPDGVTRIGDEAFEGCTSLTSIEIPEGVKTIEEYAFSGCKSLTSIEIPEGVKTIGNGAFSGCTSLTSIEIPDGITSIGEYTFSGCKSLTSIEIPEGVKTIGEYAFLNCTGLTSINIPFSVTFISMYAFKGCTSLTTFIDNPSAQEGQHWQFENSVDFSDCPLDRTSILKVFNGLKTISSDRSINLSATTNSYLTAGDRAIAFNKGWLILVDGVQIAAAHGEEGHICDSRCPEYVPAHGEGGHICDSSCPKYVPAHGEEGHICDWRCPEFVNPSHGEEGHICGISCPEYVRPEGSYDLSTIPEEYKIVEFNLDDILNGTYAEKVKDSEYVIDATTGNLFSEAVKLFYGSDSEEYQAVADRLLSVPPLALTNNNKKKIAVLYPDTVASFYDLTCSSVGGRVVTFFFGKVDGLKLDYNGMYPPKAIYVANNPEEVEKSYDFSVYYNATLDDFINDRIPENGNTFVH